MAERIEGTTSKKLRSKMLRRLRKRKRLRILSITVVILQSHLNSSNRIIIHMAVDHKMTTHDVITVGIIEMAVKVADTIAVDTTVIISKVADITVAVTIDLKMVADIIVADTIVITNKVVDTTDHKVGIIVKGAGITDLKMVADTIVADTTAITNKVADITDHKVGIIDHKAVDLTVADTIDLNMVADLIVVAEDLTPKEVADLVETDLVDHFWLIKNNWSKLNCFIERCYLCLTQMRMRLLEKKLV